MSARPARAVRRAGHALTGRVGWLLLSILLVAAVAAGTLWYAPFLRLTTVEYRTTPERSAALEEAAPVHKGQPLVQVDTEGVRRDALATGLFSTVSVTRAWPSTLVVDATARTPVVAVSGPGVSGVRLVDAQGVAYETLPSAPEGVVEATSPAPEDPVAVRALAAVVTSLPEEVRTSASDLRIDREGRLRMVLDDVDVTWGDASENRVKAAAVSRLVGRSGVAMIDVSAPLTPVTSAHRRPTVGDSGAAALPTPSLSPGDTRATSGAGQEVPGEPPTSPAGEGSTPTPRRTGA